MTNAMMTGRRAAPKASIAQMVKAAARRARRRATRTAARYEAWAATKTEWELPA